MSQKYTNKFSRKTALLFASPVLLGVIGSASVANAAGVAKLARTSSISSVSSVASRLSTGSLTTGYKLSRGEKIIGTIGIGVGVVSILGTAIGIGMTEHQYEQAKNAYDKVVDRTYYNFFEEREQTMKDLFNNWSVPMPDKYKNPLKDTTQTSNEVTKGFSIGKGE